MNYFKLLGKLGLLILTILILFICLGYKIGDYDIWWHLRVGEYIIQTKSVPQNDPFSYTAAHLPYLDIHWLYQLILAIFTRTFNLKGIVLLTLLIISFSLLFLYQCIRIYRLNSFYTFLLLILVILTLQERILIRPEMFTLLFLAAEMLILEKWRLGKTKWVWLLPVIQLIWVNTHGLFILGLFLPVCYIFGTILTNLIPQPWDVHWEKVPVPEFTQKGRLRINKFSPINQLTFIWILTVILCLFNPYGLNGLLFPVKLWNQLAGTSVFAQTIHEFKSSLKILPLAPGLVCYYLLLVLTLLSFVIRPQPIKIYLPHLLIYISLSYVSLKARRNLPIFVYTCLPMIVHNWHEFLNLPGDVKNQNLVTGRVNKPGLIEGRISPHISLLARIVRGFVLTGFSGGVIISIWFFIHHPPYERFTFGVSDQFQPQGACNFIINEKIEGNIFNELAVGGYLIYRLWPEKRVFIDGRLEVYPPEFYLNYLRMLNDELYWQQMADIYKIDIVIWSYLIPSNNRDFFVRLVNDKSRWRVVYFDARSAVILRVKSENERFFKSVAIDIYGTETPSFSEYESNTRAMFLDSVNFPDLALQEYNSVIPLYPSAYKLYNNRGRLLLRLGRLESAVSDFKKAIQLKPGMVELYNNLGAAYFELQDYPTAESVLNQALKINPNFVLTYYNLGLAYENIGNKDKAIEYYQHAVRLNPNYTLAKDKLTQLAD